MEREELEDLLAELPNWGLDSSFVPGVRPISWLSWQTPLPWADSVPVPIGHRLMRAYTKASRTTWNRLILRRVTIMHLPLMGLTNRRCRLCQIQLNNIFGIVYLTQNCEILGGQKESNRQIARRYVKAFDVLSEIYSHFGMLSIKSGCDESFKSSD